MPGQIPLRCACACRQLLGAGVVPPSVPPAPGSAGAGAMLLAGGVTVESGADWVDGSDGVEPVVVVSVSLQAARPSTESAARDAMITFFIIILLSVRRPVSTRDMFESATDLPSSKGKRSPYAFVLSTCFAESYKSRQSDMVETG